MVETTEKEPGSSYSSPLDDAAAVDAENMEGAAPIAHKDEDANDTHAHDSPRRAHRAVQRQSITAAPGDLSFHPGKIHVYSRPRQRLKWGDSQILPRVNWGDLYFDLFFVAAAYNTSNILVDSPTGRGLLYFWGCFFTIMNIWLDKIFYDARFAVADDVVHRLFELGYIVAVATIVLHTRTVDIMSSNNSYDMFFFCLAALIGTIVGCLRYLEVYFFGIGQPVIRSEAQRFVRFVLPYAALLIAATIIAAVNVYQDENPEAKGGYSTKEEIGDGHHRRLAGSDVEAGSYGDEPNDWPIILILGAHVIRWAIIAANIIFCFPTGGRHKEIIIPLHVDFAIHRYGEWCMLLLGESILSLLIVNGGENNDYYTTFYCGLLTVILLQYLHFRSQPSHADGHAMRRSKDAGILHSITLQIYSAVLISLGSAFTLMVHEFTYTDESQHRFLAGGSGAAALDADDRKQRTAHLFCGSLAMIWFCLDVMTILHLGIKQSKGRCHCQHSKRTNIQGIILLIFRAGLIVFMASLSQYETDTQNLALIGLFGVVAQLVLRKLGVHYLSGGQVHALHHDTGDKNTKEGGHDHQVKQPDAAQASAAAVELIL